MSDKVCIAFEIVDHGIEHEQYFQGCGVAYTKFEECFTGIGETAHEALEDALEIAVQSGWNVDVVENELADEAKSEIGEECHYYVSIRVREYKADIDPPEMEEKAGLIARKASLEIETHNGEILVRGGSMTKEQLDALKQELDAVVRRLDELKDVEPGS